MSPPEQQSSIPLAWTLKRTVARMRRMGIIPPSDDTHIDQVATAFVDSAEAGAPAQSHEQEQVLGRQLFDSPQAGCGSSAPDVAALETSGGLAVEGPAGREGGGTRESDDIREDGTRDGNATHTGAATSTETLDLTAGKSISEGRGVTKAISFKKTLAPPVTMKKGDISSGAVTPTKLGQKKVSESTVTKRDTTGLAATMVTSPKPEPCDKSKEEEQSREEQEDAGYESDTEQSPVRDESVWASPLPLDEEDIFAQSKRDSYSYSSRMDKPSSHILVESKGDRMNASLEETISKLTIGKMWKTEGQSARRVGECVNDSEQNVIVADMSAPAEDGETAGDLEFGGEGRTGCTVNSGTCETCCTKLLNDGE